MSKEDNIASYRQAIDALNSPDWEMTVAKLMDPADFKLFRESHVQFRKTFPDYHATIEAILGDGDMIAALLKVSGTHSAEYPEADLKGIQATGKHLEWYEADFERMKDGKMVTLHYLVQSYERMKQLGVAK